MSNSIPAIVGVAQVVQRPDDVELLRAAGPIELMTRAANEAAADAGARALLSRVGFVGVVGGWFRYRNPAQLVAAAIGAPGAATAITAISGTSPQDLVALAAQRIARGELDAALVLGGEARWSRRRLKRAGQPPPWTTEPGDGSPELVPGLPQEAMDETARLGSTAAIYALFEDRLRASRGATVDDHRTRIATLWASFSAVAATNHYAWDRTARTPAEIRDPSPQNRMISFPYTKAMVANNTVDMATAIVLCSTELAADLGIDDHRLVYPVAIAHAHETWLVQERRELDCAPALAMAADAAFAHAGFGLDHIEHIDLYACFPSMVQLSAAALGLGLDRPLTVTGGLGFAGAPVANAVGHSIATMVERVRAGGNGLVHGNGGSATKQSIGIYSARRPAEFAWIDAQPSTELRPRRRLPAEWSGPVTVEAATVVHGRDGPEHALATVVDATGARGWATTTDRDVIVAIERDGIAGLAAHRGVDEELIWV